MTSNFGYKLQSFPLFMTPIMTLMIAILSSLVSSCGKDSDSGNDKETGVFASLDYVVVDKGDLRRSESELQGSGGVVFQDPLGEIGSNKNYQASFTLEDGGQLDVVSHADENLENGVTARFTRSEGKLSVALLTKDGTTAKKVLAGVDATKSMTLSIDAHNEESPSHVLIWAGEQENPDDDNALLNSEADEETPGRGAGTFWGLVLKKATVTDADVTAARFADE